MIIRHSIPEIGDPWCGVPEPWQPQCLLDRGHSAYSRCSVHRGRYHYPRCCHHCHLLPSSSSKLHRVAFAAFHGVNGGFPGGASGKEPTCQSRRHKRRGFNPSQEDPLEEEVATHSSNLAWVKINPMDRRASRATVHGIQKSQTRSK